MSIINSDCNCIEKRIFIVGCPRSGTTILQSLLAAHPKITSFPESHFFANTCRVPILNSLGLVSPKSKEKFQDWLIDIEKEDLGHIIPKKSILVKEYVSSFITILDILTIRRNKTIWIEKTPRHLHYIDIIEKYVPDANFIHIVRNGEDVVASLYDVTHKHPEKWGGKRDINQCVNRWNDDINITKKYANKQNHFIVQFDEILRNADSCLKELCKFIDVEFDDSMLKGHSSESEKLILKSETWKESVKSGLKKETDKKIDQLFDEKQKEYIRNNLENINF